MKDEDMFTGFSVGPGSDRFDEAIVIAGQPNYCKVSSKDTHGAMCVFEFVGGTGAGPRHRHRDQDEWLYVIEGEVDFHVADREFRASAGETVFIPRQVPHAWAPAGSAPTRVLDTYQPAGTMEEFFREISTYVAPLLHEALGIDGMERLFNAHGMEIAGPPLTGRWEVTEDGRIVLLA